MQTPCHRRRQASSSRAERCARLPGHATVPTLIPLRSLLMSLLSRWIPRLCLALVMAGILGLGWLWYTYKSPLGYTPPAQATTVSSARSELDLADEHRVFVYGTLRWPWVRWLITGDDLETSPALLRGFERVGLDLEPAPRPTWLVSCYRSTATNYAPSIATSGWASATSGSGWRWPMVRRPGSTCVWIHTDTQVRRDDALTHLAAQVLRCGIRTALWGPVPGHYNVSPFSCRRSCHGHSRPAA